MPNTPIVGKQDFQDSNHKLILSIDPDSSFVQITMKTPSGVQVMQLTNTGSLTLMDAARMDGLLGEIFLGGNNKTGKIALMNGGKQNVIFLDAAGGDIVVGGSGQDGDIILQDKTGKAKMRLVGSHGHAWLGGNGTHGLFTLFPPGVENVTDTAKATVFLDGNVGDVVAGGSGQDGDIFLRDGAGKVKMHLGGQNGDVLLQDSAGNIKMHLVGSHGHAWLGGSGTSGLLTLFPATAANVTDTAKASIFLDGNTGDIVLQNADCAEDFDLADVELPEPGAIMVIDDQGKLRQSCQPYDRTVVGVLSGAGEYRPGIVLDRRPSDNPRAALTMVGKVYCKVDASYNPIGVGDLLTTSATPGHAMKAADPQQAFGAVIGKALRAHHEGPGLIPILAALQ
jgi:hypothetical protein